MIFDVRRPRDLTYFRVGAAYGGPLVGLTTGTFDMFHEMHRSFLERCRRKCGLLIVGVDSDDLVKETKGPDRPIVPEHQRVSLVSSLACVDGAFILGSLADLSELFASVNVSFFFRNQAWAGKEDEVVGSDKAKVVIIPDAVQVNSTTQLIEEILKRKKPYKYMPTGQAQPGDPGCFAHAWEPGYISPGARECRVCPAESRCKPRETPA